MGLKKLLETVIISLNCLQNDALNQLFGWEDRLYHPEVSDVAFGEEEGADSAVNSLERQLKKRKEKLRSHL